MKITLKQAEEIINNAKSKMKDLGVKMSLSVTDDRGDLIAMIRSDGASWRTPTISKGKAVAAACFGQSTKDLEARASSPIFQAFTVAENGIFIMEVGYFVDVFENKWFDTIYHEHFSYLSLDIVIRLFVAADLKVWDVEEIPTHGGSLRIYGCHADDSRSTSDAIGEMLAKERLAGLKNLATYVDFQKKASNLKNEFLEFLLEKKNEGKKVVAYGAAAKGNTLLNFAGIKSDLLPFVCDAASSKQNKYMPGSHIPILSPAALIENHPDFVIILPWNLAIEVKDDLSKYLSDSTRYVTVIPELNIC